MKVLVTGSSGFIGRHVSCLLEESGHIVIRLDNVNDPQSTDIVTDITQSLAPIPDLDAVIHLAAIASPRECDNRPGKAFDVNINGTHQILKMALESGAKKMVFSSTAHVYDIPPKYMPTDEVHPLRLNNTYTTTKILGEQLCELYWENHGLSYTTLRLFNVYGPGQQAGYFIPDKIKEGKTGNIDLIGGNTTKDWVYIDDVAWAFCLALKTAFVGPVNIGTGIETPLLNIVSDISTMLNRHFKNASDDNATRMCCDPSRAARILGWHPTVFLHEGLDAIFQAESRTVPAQP